MFFFLLLVISSAALVIVLQKVLSKLASTATPKDIPDLDTLPDCHFQGKIGGDQKCEDLIKENKRLKKQLLTLQKTCDEFEEELKKMTALMWPKSPHGPRSPEALEYVTHMNVFAVAGGECYHFDKECLVGRSQGSKNKRLKFRPCLVCLKKLKKAV